MKTIRQVSQLALTMALVFWGATNVARAVTYDFLTVASTGVASSQFTSPNGNGVINVSHVFSPGGAALLDNDNLAIFPSKFEVLFPGSGLVQGHLFQQNISSTSVVTFDLTGYTLSATTVFGIWNTNDETAPLYRVELIDASNTAQVPATFNLIGNQDNETQVPGRSQLVMDTSTGNLLLGGVINPLGTHTDAAFWDNIPAGTKQIIVYGDLPALSSGDGIGYYFAELPEPSTLVLGVFGFVGLAAAAWRKRRSV
jgi:hypothetical protein